MRDKRAFTLVELMVVVAILSILAALAFPDLRRFTVTAMEPKDVVALRGFLAEARSAARRLNRCVKVVRVDNKRLTWAPFANGSAACPSLPLPAISGSFALQISTLQLHGFVNATDANTIIFQRTGGTPYPGIATVPLARMQGSTATHMRNLKIMPATGSIKGML